MVHFVQVWTPPPCHRLHHRGLPSLPPTSNTLLPLTTTTTTTPTLTITATIPSSSTSSSITICTVNLFLYSCCVSVAVPPFIEIQTKNLEFKSGFLSCPCATRSGFSMVREEDGDLPRWRWEGEGQNDSDGVVVALLEAKGEFEVVTFGGRFDGRGMKKKKQRRLHIYRYSNSRNGLKLRMYEGKSHCCGGIGITMIMHSISRDRVNTAFTAHDDAFAM
ncbi:hypothetical protein RIF29_15664 [Crotalaria pallida]|uniref:Uncharacterized protein n=1 Tax=Crotalaria pallida TaxID=3830 RepID=A0AAN9IBD1_CROPI